MILVTGAAGKTGRAVMSALVAEKLSVRALAHREEQVHIVKMLGVDEVVVGDIHSQTTLKEAVRGIDAVYHICSNVNPDEASIGKIAIAAARAADVNHFVFHSVLHPQVEAMPHHWYKLRVEEALFESGLQFTILQPAAYMQNVLSEWQAIVERGVYAVPYSVEAPLSLVDLEDVAQAAAVVLSESGHVGGIYELTGPDVLTPNQIAAVLSNQLGRNVRAEKMPFETWKRRAEASGFGSYQIEALGKMFNYYDRCGLWGSSSVLEGLLGRSPTPFEEFVDRITRQGNR